MKRILITGGSGQLGSELKDLYQDRRDVKAIFVDREQLPLDDIDTIVFRISKYNPDVIIHSAAYTAVDKAETEIELADKVNHLATAEIAKYCKKYRAKLIAVSTDYVFDGKSSVPLKEDTAENPINVYGETKLNGEQAIKAIFPDAIIVRTSWLYSIYGNNFVKTVLRFMNERDEISVINDQIGSPTYALDLAKAIVHIIDYKMWTPGVYHFSNEGEISWYDFAVAIREIKGLKCIIHPISTISYPTPAKRPRFSLLDKNKIKSTFNLYVPFWKNSLNEMLKKLYTKRF